MACHAGQFSPFSLTLNLQPPGPPRSTPPSSTSAVLASAAPITYAAVLGSAIDLHPQPLRKNQQSPSFRLTWNFNLDDANKMSDHELDYELEGEGFKQFIEVVQPMWKPPGRLVMAKNCMLIYGEEKMALKQIVKHQRCSAHILNLIVREGLQEIDDPIGRVRNIVRYVRSSPSRMAEFWSCVEKEGITCRLKPCLDVSTRWNYTYFMLERALTYQKAFDRLCDDPSFKLNVREEEIDEAFDDVDGFEGMGRIIEIEKRKKKRGRGRKENVGPPTSSDWEKIKLYVKFLRVFYLATLKFSGSLYVTCNVFFDEMVLIQQDIVKLCETDDSELHDMALGMREKFDKYWGDFDKINQMLMFAVVLDPRCKIGFFEYCFRNTLGYDKMVVGELTDNITNGITRLFEWYVKNNANLNVRNQEVGGSSDKGDLDGVEMEIGSHKSLKSQFKMHMQKETNMACKSELEKYLAEASEDDSEKFDVLRWWKLNSSKYPIVSQMARDVLAIPVSTVASESAFSTGGRVIDPYRSSLSPKTVEALICTQQWIRKPTKINIKEQLDELEQLDSGTTLFSS
ncbi:hypothetical protein RHSIM_Rhsim13G0128000 [Rhododendron simsii]|uniref:Zinc finger BED domain-containing protein RICESLEEPER 2-like n=1 Tax=Rhododendron simsii TaxID=118357 RepID=A0A834G220_RHOSS|nr:hypothetical protein RHSIM_Rhsim13G0128000 [Rhododendron simsii]